MPGHPDTNGGNTTAPKTDIPSSYLLASPCKLPGKNLPVPATTLDFLVWTPAYQYWIRDHLENPLTTCPECQQVQIAGCLPHQTRKPSPLSTNSTQLHSHYWYCWDEWPITTTSHTDCYSQQEPSIHKALGPHLQASLQPAELMLISFYRWKKYNRKQSSERLTTYPGQKASKRQRQDDGKDHCTGHLRLFLKKSKTQPSSQKFLKLINLTTVLNQNISFSNDFAF